MEVNLCGFASSTVFVTAYSQRADGRYPYNIAEQHNQRIMFPLLGLRLTLWERERAQYALVDITGFRIFCSSTCRLPYDVFFHCFHSNGNEIIFTNWSAYLGLYLYTVKLRSLPLGHNYQRISFPLYGHRPPLDESADHTRAMLLSHTSS